MIFNTILLALSSSIDSLGVGITYGVKKTKISIVGIMILFLLSIIITNISILLGNLLNQLLNPKASIYVGSLLLIGMGIFIIYEALFPKKHKKKKRKEYNLFIKYLGITINIIKDPINSDMDKSNKIDFKEAMFLGFALSLDAVCIGFGGSIIGINSLIFPLLISIFQILFLCIGSKIGRIINNFSNVPQNLWNIISGLLLIFIGILKIF